MSCPKDRFTASKRYARRAARWAVVNATWRGGIATEFGQAARYYLAGLKHLRGELHHTPCPECDRERSEGTARITR